MSNYICRSCRSSLLRSLRARRSQPIRPTVRAYSSTLVENDQAQSQPQEDTAKSKKEYQEANQLPPLDISALLSTPTWSVRSLLPDQDKPIPPSEVIDQKKLHHFLRLSALPYPKDETEEKSMIDTLHSQLHFVRDIQSVDTEGIEPLMSIRDETREGIQEATVTMDTLKRAFMAEEIVGQRLRRPRRKRKEGMLKRVKGVEDWDPLSTASEVVERGGGRFFVVRSGKVEEESGEPKIGNDGS